MLQHTHPGRADKGQWLHELQAGQGGMQWAASLLQHLHACVLTRWGRHEHGRGRSQREWREQCSTCTLQVACTLMHAHI